MVCTTTDPDADDDDAGHAVRGGSGVCEQGETNMSKKVDLTRRKVLGGLASIGAASAAAGAGTMAYFSDTEDSTGNTVSAGTLNLNATDTADGMATTTVNIDDVAPGDSNSGSSTLKNTGSIAGSVDLVFGSASNSEGNNPEAETDPDGDSNGDLGENLQVEVYVGSTLVRGDFNASSPPTFNDVFDNSEANSNVALGAGSSKDLTISWNLPSSVGNEIQGDSVSGDITIELNQTDGQ